MAGRLGHGQGKYDLLLLGLISPGGRPRVGGPEPDDNARPAHSGGPFIRAVMAEVDAPGRRDGRGRVGRAGK